MTDINPVLSDIPMYQDPSELISPQLHVAITHFRRSYPMGSVITELTTIHTNQFVVRAIIYNGTLQLGSGMAMDKTVEQAEDQAKLRAIASVILSNTAASKASISWSTESNEVLATSPLSAWKTTKHTSLDSPIEQTDDSFSDRPDTPPPTPVRSDSVPSDDSWSNAQVELANIDDGTSHSRQRPTTTNKESDVHLPYGASGESKDLGLDPLQTNHSIDQPVSPKVSLDEISNESEPTPAQKKQVQKKAAKKKPRSTSSQSHVQSSKEDTKTVLPSDESTDSMPLSVDLSDIIAKTSVELKRLGWTDIQGREHLNNVYGKRSRQHLTDPELLDFLTYLETQPTPS